MAIAVRGMYGNFYESGNYRINRNVPFLLNLSRSPMPNYGYRLPDYTNVIYIYANIL
jgi:hypothetical protein